MTSKDYFTVVESFHDVDHESTKQAILRALQHGAKLTRLDMLKRFNCMNGTQRISDLRKENHAIHTEMIRLNNGKRIAMYSLQKPVKNV
jgi:hypothetical protein